MEQEKYLITKEEIRRELLEHMDFPGNCRMRISGDAIGRIGAPRHGNSAAGMMYSEEGSW